MLRHNVVTDEPAGFADIERVRPTVSFNELIFGKTPMRVLFADRRRHGGIVRQEPLQTLLVSNMGLEDFLTLGVARVRPGVVLSDKVGRESPVVIGVGFLAGNGIKF